jgi:putative ABC transport system permease protein
MRLLRFTLKSLRFDKFYNFFFTLCFGAALVGLIFVESLENGITQKIKNQAQKGIASDLIISSRMALSEEKKTILSDFLKEHDLGHTPWIETYSLVAKKNGEAKLAHLNFVGNLFPFYGTITLENKKTLSPTSWKKLHEAINSKDKIVWVDKGLAFQLNLKIGDELKIGESFFKVDDFIVDDDFSSFRGLSFAPKIFISYKYIEKTKLIQFGSTANHATSIKIKTEQNLFFLKEQLRNKINDKSIRVLDFQDSGQQSNRALSLLNDYLGLISLVAYVLGLLGLYYFTQYILSKKIKTIAIYKSLGLDFKFLFKVEVLHLFLLIIFSVLGAYCTFLLTAPYLQNLVQKLSGESLLFSLSTKGFVKILLMGVAGVYLSLLPLYWASLKIEVRAILGQIQGEIPKIKLYNFLPLLIYISFLSVHLSHSIKVGLLFLGALFVLLLMSYLLLRLLFLLASKNIYNLGFLNTHALKLMRRYFHSTFTIFISFALGICLLVLISQVENSLKNDLLSGNSAERADLFVFDLQENDLEKFQKINDEHHFKTQIISPMIRARFIKVNEKKLAKDEEQLYQTRESENEERFRNRGVNLSYRENLAASERVVEGSSTLKNCKTTGEPCELSLELNYAKRLGIKMNDRLTFDVSGIEVEGIVKNLRRVKWTSFDPNFFILFGAGILEDAPKTYLASLKVKSFEEKKSIYREMSKHLPMVSIVDISEVIKKISKIFDIMAWGIKLSALLSLFMSILVLFSVVFNHLELRKRDMQLFFLMGLSKSKIVSLFFRKFAVLLFLSVILSTLVATGVSYFLLTRLLNVEFSFSFANSLLPGILINLFLMSVIFIKLKLFNLQSKN